tara:strand:- start:619 stop:957 length:339 start_codon:yes stop_codon:yes gene_type:complete
MRAARIESGIVADLWIVPSLTAFEGVTLIEAPHDVNSGWLYDGEVFTAPAKADEKIASEARSKRRSLLAETDFHGFTDNTMTAEMTTYRQALRDVPQQEGFPNEINWPVKPS